MDNQVNGTTTLYAGTTNAAEGTLEGTTGTGYNPFVAFTLGELTTEGDFLGFGGKDRFTLTSKKVSFKRNDIASLTENKDDFGTTYTTVYVGNDSGYTYAYGDDQFYVFGTLESVRTYVNNQ